LADAESFRDSRERRLGAERRRSSEKFAAAHGQLFVMKLTFWPATTWKYSGWLAAIRAFDVVAVGLVPNANDTVMSHSIRTSLVSPLNAAG
jgi:hypothetical protein